MFCKLRKLCTYIILHMFFNAYIYIYIYEYDFYVYCYIYIERDEIYANISAYIHIYIGRLYIHIDL